MDKIIRVTGEGKVSVPPDTIEVGLQLSELDKNYTKSLEKVDKKVNLLKKEMEKIDIKDVKTQNFSVRPKINRTYGNNIYKDKFEGYETYHSLKISFDYNTSKLGEVVNAISTSLSEPRLTISFTVKKLDGLKEKALKNAVENAKKDAEALALALGVELGEILSINHSFGEVRYSYPNSAEFMAKSCEAECCAGSSLSEISVDDIDFSANVTIEWKIR